MTEFVTTLNPASLEVINSKNYLSANTSFYTQAQSNANFLSANTSYYTQSQANANFLSASTNWDNRYLSANTSYYTQAQSNANFLSANTSYYTQAQTNANFLSAITLATIEAANSAYTLMMYQLATGYTNTQVNSSITYIESQSSAYTYMMYQLATGYTNSMTSGITVDLSAYYTSAQTNDNFLSANTYIPSNNNFLSANTIFIANNDASSAYTLMMYQLATGYTDYKTGTGSTFDPTLYYTKTNLQTSGQSSVNWNNITNSPFVYNGIVQSGTGVLDQLISGNSFSTAWEYSINDVTNIGTGYTGVKIAYVIACWDNKTGKIEFSEISTKSIGDTSDFDDNYSIISNGGNIQFYVSGLTHSWDVRLIRRIL